MQNQNQAEFKGFSLFNDIEDDNLRTFNRARVMANMAEDHISKEKRISAKGAALILGYFNLIPKEERNVAKDLFQLEMNNRGFALTA
mgnify:FL=1